MDGFIHQVKEVKKNDKMRQKQVEEQELSFLRFSNDEIKLPLEKVISQMEKFLQSKNKTLIRKALQLKSPV